MAIVPIEADGISSDRVDFVGSHGGLENRQRGFWLRLLFARCSRPSASRSSTQVAHGHAARNQAKRPVAGVAIFPYNLDARTLRLVDADMLGIDGVARKFFFRARGFARGIFRKNADAFVAHTFVLHLSDRQ